MSIIIKGMDMPKKDTGCRIIILYDGQVAMDDGTFIPKYKAVEIPTPHGRLIDAEELRSQMEDAWISYRLSPNYPTYGDSTAMAYLDFAPTILEAEE